jgi:uncharacterized membrane protein YgcG
VNKSKRFIGILVTMGLLVLLLASCGSSVPTTSGDAEYEKKVVTFEGLADEEKTITVAELREFPHVQVEASYKRTTGMEENYTMSGPLLKDVIASLGGNIDDYDGIGVMGSDGYFCLLSREVIKETPDLSLAVVVDGEAKLPEEDAPVRLAIQGQMGPYWVKKVDRIILYKKIPEKDISSVWVFNNLVDGIEPYEYEYYGSYDKAFALEKIFARFDFVDSKAFFNMKAVDGLKKNDVLNMIKSDYYIKVEGEDAPTNVFPHMKLGMNVKEMAWFSTNVDATIFPEQMSEFMDQKEIKGQKGLPLSEIMYEVGAKEIKDKKFVIIGMDGEKIPVTGTDLEKGVLVIKGDGVYTVVWESDELESVKNLLRIEANDAENKDAKKDNQTGKKNSDKGTAGQTSGSSSGKKTGGSSNGSNSGSSGGSSGGGSGSGSGGSIDNSGPTVLTVQGSGVTKTTQWSLNGLKSLKSGYAAKTYSAVNNYPTKKFFVGKGVTLNHLLSQSGIKSNAATITVIASDGYKETFTKNQLLGTAYYYPNVTSGSSAGASSIPAILAWESKEGSSSLSSAVATPLRLLMGQRGVSYTNAPAFVQKVRTIEVSTAGSGSWEKVSASVAQDGDKKTVTLSHPRFDNVCIYYTLDGSTPNHNSKLYNPSASYYQPELNKPITFTGSKTIKAIAMGYGKNDSAVATFNY